MRRYIFSARLQDTASLHTDVVIIGCGVAGLYTALNLDPRINCVLLNKAGAEISNSMYAQGGIAAVLEPGPLDNPQQHYLDTLAAGAGLCNEKAVRVLVDEAQSDIERLISMEVPFDSCGGRFVLSREGGHSRARVLHCGGDATGPHMTRRLYEIAAGRDNIVILDRMFLADILTDENGAAGVLALDERHRACRILASKVVIASGGIGRVYLNSTNAVCATGDGIAAAARAGAELRDMEFVQFHPTAFLYPFDSGRFFLISEALRGEGAVLRNSRGEPFMQGLHELADLAPRDVVSRAIAAEMKKEGASHVYLDITAKPESFLKKRFPTIYENCLRNGINAARDWIPVIPAQHYLMGGIQTDIYGRTNIPGLYACGEAACTGVHGANRLASNSLLECVVFGRRCAQHISGSALFAPKARGIEAGPCIAPEELNLPSLGREIRALMTDKCGIIRRERELLDAYRRVGEIFGLLDVCSLDTPQDIETYNQALVAMETLLASLLRRQSVGAHYRADDNSVRRK